LVANSALVFWILIKQRRALWCESAFWLTIVTLFALHSVAFIAVLLKVDEWPLVWFVPCVVIEVLVCPPSLKGFFHRGDERVPPNTGPSTSSLPQIGLVPRRHA
jgi:hypothetical protein